MFALNDIAIKEQCMKCLLTCEAEYPVSLIGFLLFVDLKYKMANNT